MRSAFGLLIILWGLSQFFASSMRQLDSTATTTLQAIETAAAVSRDAMTVKD